MNHPAAALELAQGQRGTLERLAASRSTPHQLVRRARALLLAGEGVANTEIAEHVGISVVTVRAWRERFQQAGLVDLGIVRPGRGRKPEIPPEKVEAIVHATLHEKPPTGETRWSCRSMARDQGVSPATVQRIWSARGLRPHGTKTFKLSDDARFEEQLIDVVGLYLNPPEKALALCMNENALDRAQPSLPMKPGRSALTRDHSATAPRRCSRRSTCSPGA